MRISRIFMVLAHCAPHQPPRGRAAALGGPAAFNQIQWAPPGRAVRRGVCRSRFFAFAVAPGMGRRHMCGFHVFCQLFPPPPSHGTAAALDGPAAFGSACRAPPGRSWRWRVCRFRFLLASLLSPDHTMSYEHAIRASCDSFRTPPTAGELAGNSNRRSATCRAGGLGRGLKKHQHKRAISHSMAVPSRRSQRRVACACSAAHGGSWYSWNDAIVVRSDVRDGQQRFCANPCRLFLCGGF